MKKHIQFLAVIIYIVAASFYFYDFMLQVTVGVIARPLMYDLSIDAEGIGIISACFLYTYTLMQIPAGLLFDRFGVVRPLFIAIVVCSLGTLLFSMSNHLLTACLGRFLMGLGSAFSYIGCLLLINVWFTSQYFALLVGILSSLSSLGAIIGEGSLAIMKEHLGWQYSLLLLSMLGFILAVLVLIFVKDHPPGLKVKHEDIQLKVLSKFLKIIKNPQLLCMAIYAFFSWVSLTVFAALWGIPFLNASFHFSTKEAAFFCSFIWIAFALFGPILGRWSDYIKRRRIFLISGSLIGVISSMTLLYVPNIPPWIIIILLLCFGVTAATSIVLMALVKDITSPSNIGAAIGVVNMSGILSGAIFQPFVGYWLTKNWDGRHDASGTPIYDVMDYRMALSIIPLFLIISLIISIFFIKDTRTYPQTK